MEAASKASVVCLALAKHETFVAIESLGYDPQRKLDVIIERYKVEKNYLPDVIVYDYLDYPKVRTKEEINPFKMQKAVVDAAIALKAAARERNILIVAFCQADPGLTESKKIIPSGIAEFKGIAAHADAFIGISHRRKSHRRKSYDADMTANGIYERVQYLTVTSKTRPSPAMVAVERAFEYQRFEEPRWRPRDGLPDELGETDHRARIIEKTSEFPGYVLARRKRFYEIFACGVPYAINLYAFLLLVAGSKDHQLGKSGGG